MATKRAEESELVPLNMRMPRGLIEALDAEVERLNRADPFQFTTRSLLVRDLLAQGLRARQATPAPKAKPGPPARKR